MNVVGVCFGLKLRGMAWPEANPGLKAHERVLAVPQFSLHIGLDGSQILRSVLTAFGLHAVAGYRSHPYLHVIFISQYFQIQASGFLFQLCSKIVMHIITLI